MNKKRKNTHHNDSLLPQQNHCYRDTGGISQNNKKFGFIPAFYDSISHTVYLSRFSNGSPAPVHILEGLPEHLLENRIMTDKLDSEKNTLIAGFVSGKQFLTRQQAAETLVKTTQQQAKDKHKTTGQ